jgi:hypothetical protein
MLDDYKDAIAALLPDDPEAPATVIIEHLRRDGYQGAITILKEHLAQVRAQFLAAKHYQRTSYLPGEIGQFDWWHTGVQGGVPVGDRAFASEQDAAPDQEVTPRSATRSWRVTSSTLASYDGSTLRWGILYCPKDWPTVPCSPALHYGTVVAMGTIDPCVSTRTAPYLRTPCLVEGGLDEGR